MFILLSFLTMLFLFDFFLPQVCTNFSILYGFSYEVPALHKCIVSHGVGKQPPVIAIRLDGTSIAYYWP